MRWTRRLIFALFAVAPASAYAQSPSTACAFDTAAFTFNRSFTLAISAANLDLTPSDGPPEAVEAARTIAAYFDPPASVGLPFWRGSRPPARTGHRRPRHGWATDWMTSST